MKNNINILATVVILLFLLASCEDLPPNVYDPKPYVEAYLIVDQPIKNVRIMWTQSLTDTFNYEKSFIRDAEVLLHFNDKTIKLISPRSGTDGYYYPDTNLKVLPQTEYKLDILLKDGSNITVTTYTPGRFNWTIPPPPELYYPQDTINLSDAPDTLKLAWEKNPPGIYYFIRVQCLDTANYGIYLNPPTADSNRRVYKPYDKPNNPNYTKTQIWGMVPLNETPVVWTFFKWYGKQKVSVLTPDYNFMKWALQYFRTGQYNPLLGNIKGDGIGIFGSASEIDAEVFLYMPRKEP